MTNTGRPPVHRWLLYRLFEVRVPYEYRAWVRQDVLGRGFFLRYRLSRAFLGWCGMTLAWLSMWLLTGELLRYPAADQYGMLITAAWVLGAFIPVPPLDRGVRRRILHKHEFLLDGTPFEAVPRVGSNVAG